MGNLNLDINLKDRARRYHRAVSNYNHSVIEEMVEKDYIQHNPFVPTGRTAFLDFLPTLRAHGSKIVNLRMLVDDCFVVMHHLWNDAFPFGARSMEAFHIIRFNRSGNIAEHWNVMRPLSDFKETGRSSISGETEILDLEKTESNRRRVEMLYQADGNLSHGSLEDFFSSGLVQHDPRISDGSSGIHGALLSRNLNFQGAKLHRVFCQGNFALAVSEGPVRGEKCASYNLFRLESDKIVEHWGIHQPIPTENLANDNTMFGF